MQGLPHFSFLSDDACLAQPSAPAFVQVSNSPGDEQDEEMELMLLYRPWKDRFLAETELIIEDRTSKMQIVIRCKANGEYSFSSSLSLSRRRARVPQFLARAAEYLQVQSCTASPHFDN